MIQHVIKQLCDGYAKHPEYQDVKYIVHDANRSKVIVSFKQNGVKRIEEINVEGVGREGIASFVFNWIVTYGITGKHQHAY